MFFAGFGFTGEDSFVHPARLCAVHCYTHNLFLYLCLCMRCFMQLFNGHNFSLIYSIGGKWAVIPYYQTGRFDSSVTLPALKSLTARREVNKEILSSYDGPTKKVARVHIYPTGLEAWVETALPCGLSVAGFEDTFPTLPTKTRRDAINRCPDTRMVVLTRGKWWTIDLNISDKRVLINL